MKHRILLILSLLLSGAITLSGQSLRIQFAR